MPRYDSLRPACFALLLAATLLFAGCSNSGSSDSGDLVVDTNPPGAVLDGTFGGGTGRALLSASTSVAMEVVEDTNGNLVVAGTLTEATGDVQVAVWRLLPNGDPDSSFGVAGLTILDVSAATPDSDTVAAVAIDDTDKIVVTGSADGVNGDRDVYVARLFTSGLPDLNFGTSGTGVVYVGNDDTIPHDDTAANLVIGAGNTIQVIGNSREAGTTLIGELATWRILTIGLPDLSFGTDGLYLSGSNGDRGVALLNDLTGLSYLIGSRAGALTIWRLDPAGVLDPTFAVGGISTIPAASGSLIPTDGKIYDNISFMVVGRRTVVGDPDRFFATRIFIDGTLETSFGNNGFLNFTSFNGDSGAQSFGVASSGQVIVAGDTTLRDPTTSVDSPAGALWLITAAGAFDPTLAGGGVAHLSGPSDSGTSSNSVIVDSMNRLVIAGSADLGSGSPNAIVWRAP